MKKIFNIVLLSSTVFFMSCEKDMFKPYYPGALTEDVAIQTSGDLQKLMNTSYSLLTPGNDIEFNSIFTDEAGVGYSNGGQGLNDNYAFLLNSNSDNPAGIWSTYYSTLAVVNRVIKFSDRIVPADDVDKALIQKLKAEALTIRAHCHLQLISYFSTNPKDDNALGCMIADDFYSPGFSKGRSTNGEGYLLINKDLDDAIVLYNSAASAFDPIYASKNFALALKARMYLLRGDYANAYSFADQVITTSGVGISAPKDYKSIFHTDANPSTVEVIFKIKKLVNQTKIGSIWASVNATIGGSPFFEVGRSLYNLMDSTNDPNATKDITITDILSGSKIVIPNHGYNLNDVIRPSITSNGFKAGKLYFVNKIVDANTVTVSVAYGSTSNAILTAGTGLSIAAKTSYGDVRYSINVDPSSIVDINYATSSDFRNTDKLIVAKYPGTSANGNLVNDIKICRISEMYFIKAEALAAQGKLVEAAAEIKKVRDSRYSTAQPAPVYATAVAALKDILKERRVEFAFEGYRYLDLKRLGVAADETISRDPQDCAINNACSIPNTDHRFTLPIPVIEINGNPGIASQQNPGY